MSGRFGVIENAKECPRRPGNPMDATPPMSGNAEKGRNPNCGRGRNPEPSPHPGSKESSPMGPMTTLLTVVAADPWTSASPL